MTQRTLFALGVVLAGLLFAYTQFQEHSVAAAPKDDEQAVLKATDSYAAAFNKADVDAIIDHWAADAEYIDDAGSSTKGREALTALFKSALKENKDTKVQIKTGAVRFFNDVAWQDGHVILSRANGEMESSPFTAVWTKKDGKWLLNLVRDQPTQPITEKDEPQPIRELAWLIGEWVHEEKDVKTVLNAKWMNGEKFLIIDLTVHNKGVETMSLVQLIGWDPTGNQLHSWVFDTRGGFGEGYWKRKGSAWTVDVAGVTADGRHGTGTNIWKMIDENSFVFEGTDRDVGGQALPDIKVTYQRVKKAK